MVCIYCQSKTTIINSRYNKELHKTWRRHKCKSCHTIFTTYETIDFKQSIKISNNSGHIEPFNKNQLFLSIYKSVEHLDNALSAAEIVTDAVLRRIFTIDNLPVIKSSELARITALVLKRYDAAATIRYLSTKNRLQLPKDVNKALKNINL